MVKSVESTAVSFLRRIWMGLTKGDVTHVNGLLPVEVASYLQNRKRKELSELENRYQVKVNLHGDPSLPPGGGTIDFVRKTGA